MVLKQSLYGIVAAFCVWATTAEAQDFRSQDLTSDALKALPQTPGALLSEIPAAAELERAKSARDPRLKRARAVSVNPNYVNAMLETAALQTDAAGEIVGEPTQQVLNLFDDLKVPVVKLKQARDSQGNTIWTGGIVDDPMGHALVVIDEGEITASISTNGRNVTIFPAGDGTHLVREMTAPPRSKTNDARRAPADGNAATQQESHSHESHNHDHDSAAPLATPLSQSDRERPQASTTLHIYVVYTARALNVTPNMSSAVSLAMAHLNTTLSNSQIDVQAELVGLERVNYTESTGDDSDDNMLDDATDGVGDFSRIRLARAAMRADLIAVIGNYDPSASCGLAWLNESLVSGSITSTRARLGVSLTHVNCLPSTFSHEVGHNIGANHDRFVVDGDLPGPTEYNFGYVDTTARFMDVMAYNDQCDDLNISCTEIQYFSNPNVRYEGRPTGIATSQATAANNGQKIGETAPLVAQFSNTLSTTSATLAVFVSGTGTVTSSTGGINCGVTCSASFTAGTSVTLTPTPPRGSRFVGWSGGGCSGTSTCTVTVSAATGVTATFTPALRLGSVYASSQAESQSFLRFANTGSTAGNVSVVLGDIATGQVLGTWTSPSIPAGATLQSPITTIESAIPAGTARPQFYSAAVQSSLSGYIQHVLYRPADGTLTNLSTCDTGVTATPTQVASVHSGLLDFGFPSMIAVTNLSINDEAATLGIFDSNTGARLGTYTTPIIVENGQALITVAAIESALGLKPSPTQFHYTVKIEGSFQGALQHLVNNLNVGVITDMTTHCSFGTVTAPAANVAIRQPGPIFSSAQSASQSFLRFYNTGTSAGTVNVNLYNFSTGGSMGNWTSGTIQPGQSEQVEITVPETVIGPTGKPQYYTTWLQSQMTGYFQHVLYRPADGTLTNLSTCEAGVGAETGQLINVHSSLLDFGFPSSIVVANPTTTATTASLGIYDARNGTKLGTYTSQSIPPNAQVIVPVATMQSQIGLTPNSSQFHYVIKAEGTFNGFLQHVVTNRNRGVITDMTAMCQLPARAVRYNTCFPSACSASVGTPTTGQLKKENYYENFRVNLTAGVTYTIDVKGASTGDGTLTRPFVFIYGPNGGGTVKQGGGGGTGNNARLTFTPTTTGSHTIQVTAYIYANNAGSFVLTVN